MVTAKPLFIADIGIGVGMPRMKKYLKCNLNSSTPHDNEQT
ncbi:TPA_asm: truncated semaphorin-like protein [Vaccinia virus]|nr:putative A39R [Vaccinia virus]UIC71923.1 truncated semaphorin-like protein [Vaccinia virus]DAD53055.1 TPA_asm: truncated semaphorin-like protein [Vaccinia virus]DAD53768.1 TPA_asm: truncated semaphorin-like protein [Vaccinia virus]DAD54024.1 TPA_asm: truncated semaphorin-like protein [Vaccinia virus]